MNPAPPSDDDVRPSADTAERPLHPSQLQWYRLQRNDVDNTAPDRHPSFCQSDERPVVTAELFSALVRLPPILKAQHGRPSCIALHARYVAIGTSAGTVVMSPLTGAPTAMTFESEQSRNTPLQSVYAAFLIDAGKHGAVSAADLRSSGAHLGVAHENGAIVLWDVFSKAVVKSVAGMHANPIMSLRFVPGMGVSIVSADVKGVVNLTVFNKHIIGWSVSKYAIERNLGQITSTALSRSLCALVASFNDLAVYDISGTRPVEISRLTLPAMCFCLAWGGQNGHILAVEQNGAIVTFQIRDKQLMQLQRLALSKAPLSFASFLSTSCIAFISDNELIAVDINSMARLQSISIAGVAIATHDRYDNPGTMQSVLSSDHAIRLVPSAWLVILAANGALYQVAMLNPLYRIRTLTDSGRWVQALSLALDVYEAEEDAEERSLVESRCRTLTLSYLKANFDSDLHAVYANVFDFCIGLKNFEFLFDNVFRFSSGHLDHYFSALLDAIETNSAIRRVPLRIITECVAHCCDSPRLERCISVLEPADIQNLHPICVKYRMWLALFTLSQRAQLLPSVPAQALLSSVDEGDPAELHAVLHLKRYTSLSSTLEEKQDVLAFLLSSEPPVLHRLLVHHVSELIPTIGDLLLLDIWATTTRSHMPTRGQSVFAGLINKTEKPAPFRTTRDDAVDALLSAMVNARETVTCPFGWAIPIPLSPFGDDDLVVLTIALSKPLESGAILVSPLFLRLVLLRLLMARNQEAVLRGIVARLPPDHDLLPQMLVASRMVEYQLLTIDLYKFSGDVISCLDAFLACTNPDIALFDYLQSWLRSSNATLLRDAILARTKPLVVVDGARMASLIMEFYPNSVGDVIGSLSQIPELQFPFLEGLLTIAEFDASPDVHETYIRLLAMFEPKRVLTYIKSHYEYSMENVLVICQNLNVVDANCFLLERTGDIEGALMLMLNSLDPLILALRDEAKSRTKQHNHRVRISDLQQLPSAPDLKQIVSELATLCQRHSQFTENEKRWSLVLDRLVKARNCESDQLVQFALVEAIQGSLAAMRGYVPLSSILLKIISDHSDAVYVEFRETILSLIETLAYDADMLRLCNAIMTEDNNLSVVAMCNMMARPVVSSAICAVCGTSLERSDQILFVCGHASHQACCTRDSCHRDSCHLCFRPANLSHPYRPPESVQLP